MESLEARRRAEQSALLDSGREFEIGDAAAAPWPIDRLAAVRGDEPEVVQTFRGGLTAVVHRLRIGDRDWTLKLARRESRVRNDDGRLAFVNELLRRADFGRLKATREGARRFRGIVDTTYGSLRRGLLLSPWLDGGPVRDWNERSLAQVIGTLIACAEHGLFDWDPSPGNLVDDGRQVRLFDFGYAYPFDPCTQFNSAGRGDDVPVFHPAERFETRTFFAHLLAMETQRGVSAALAAFRLGKQIALDAYRRHRAALADAGASAAVLARLDAIVARWQTALQGDALDALYLAEGWRSHSLDLDDDLHGRSCTPTTLARADWLVETAARSHAALVAHDALLGGDRDRSAATLVARYRDKRREAEAFLLAHDDAA